jgi:hypothetical protein
MSLFVAPNISSGNAHERRETPPPLFSLEERRRQLRESATRPYVAKKSRKEESGFVDQADCAAAGAIAHDAAALSAACRTPVADVVRLASRVAEHLNALPIPARTTEAFDPHLDGLARALSSACVRWRDHGAEFEAELRRRVTPRTASMILGRMRRTRWAADAFARAWKGRRAARAVAVLSDAWLEAAYRPGGAGYERVRARWRRES